MIVGKIKKLTVTLEDDTKVIYSGEGTLERIETYRAGETKSVKDRTSIVMYSATISQRVKTDD